MNIQGFFTTDLLNIYDIYGNLKSTEKIHLTRQGISNNDFSHTHKYKGLCEKETQIDEGDLCITESNDKFLVTIFGNVIMSVKSLDYKINTLEILEQVKKK